MSPRALLAGILAVGAALRFWNIHDGLPYRIGVDEPVIAERAIHMMRTGSFHPHFYDYPGLYIYVQLVIGCARFVIGAVDGLWRSVDQFHPEHLFAWTRSFNAAIGTATIFVLYRAALRWGVWTAVSAAALLALWPNHVRESHFALTDVPLTFLTTAAFALSLRAFETRTFASFAAAGATAGLAAATKYTGAYALVMPLMAAGLMPAPASVRLAAGALASAGAGAAFLAASPYTVLDLPGFLNAFGTLSAYYRARPFGDGASIYLGHLRVASGWVGVLLAAAGIVWGTARALRDRDLRRWAIVVAFPLLFFYAVATKHLVFARYLLPMVPFLCLFIGLALSGAASAISRLKLPGAARLAAAAALVAIAVFPIARGGIGWPSDYGRPTTQDLAYEKIIERVPKGSGVLVERSVLRLPDTLYRKTDVHRFVVETPEAYVSRGLTYVIASSDAFGPVLERPSDHAREYDAYQRVFSNPGHCLPTIQPTKTIQGPQIVICRLDAPIQ